MASLCLAQGAAQAKTTAYAQLPSGSGFVDVSSIYNLPGDPGFTWSLDSDEETWAYFTPATAGSFNRITWYGSQADGAFAVDFFAANCFSCGVAPVATNGRFANNLLPVAGPFKAADVHKTALSANLYAYSIDLPSVLNLNAGSLYALTVVNNFSSAPFQWAGSASGSGTHLRYIIGQAMFLRAPGNLAFALEDTTPAVPEPATALCMALGLATVWLSKRRPTV